ncbi:MAG: LysR family transcriptional regulator [Clostridia bacterium]|nr:LysR family transcriptional regulator [Clostridia bacterium]
MEIRVLKYFLEVAKEGNITRAAEHLHVSQPTISKQIKELEEELGVRLFTRTNYAIKLTQPGVLLKERAEDIIGLVNKTGSEFKSLDDISGDIYIGAAESQLMQYFAQAVKSVMDKYPKIHINIFSGDSAGICERLDKGIDDFGLILNYFDPKKYNYYWMSNEKKFDTWGVLMRKDDPLATKSSLKLNNLIGLPLICSKQWKDESMSHWFKDNTNKLNLVATYNLAYNASVLVKQHIGYAIMLDGLINTGKDSEFCFVPISDASKAGLNIIWRKNQTFSPAARLLMDELELRYSKQAKESNDKT